MDVSVCTYSHPCLTGLFSHRSNAHLPDQCAGGIFLATPPPVAAPQAIRRSQGFSLHDLCIVHVTRMLPMTVNDRQSQITLDN